MGSVKVEQLTKEFSGVKALHDINLDIQEGEFFALLGPSGCGKTTTMRCIAGFEQPTSGEIKIGDQVVNQIPPNKRSCGMVFQSYALFPHMDVFDNVAYSLNIKQLKASHPLKRLSIYIRMFNKKLSKYPKEMEDRVRQILEYVELDKYANRLTSELSGGQQQRVALARALVMEPKVLLMDEPLSNLDQKLRHTMRTTIRRIQQDLKITTIFVTHDQEEAMSMADRVAVMKDGQVIQIGTPTELYSQPASPFIADFVGTSNILPGKVITSKANESVVQINGKQIKSTYQTDKEEVNVIIRPENITILSEGTPSSESDVNIFEGKINQSTYLGSAVRYEVLVNESTLIVDTTYFSGREILKEGTKVQLAVSSERVLLI
ncbi:ABC transporter ATP-binding protein [Heyndrickxia sporothermodurans]|nr:ABC transporter ATP-binding protein [Heyndrickxia sporothermodurans]MBL5768992.1 ABC transporter ATP-binding protein [Heyndrickxia sporothermodurans]MBL5772770.1 ABC transporter ATP-binding protein [Heyndrickxia sporothermodurans]MBL5779792.1 ABC transporter ATP-binding protein [Heyndrickxia sporothermodurans]MBL5783359.1 ABC transporter ATP-binding protein [Heyndrickxia sporothermodurans]MBL5786868.1 ABC transporter ATP-binding protein [Heyndrickxia sporothermodurans]